MITVRSGLVSGAAAVIALLSTLSVAGRLGVAGWCVGLLAGALLCATVARAATGAAISRLGPADLVTVLRAALTCGAAGLVADAVVGPPARGALVAVVTVALLLDLVDGQVARRTATASAFGARLDGEADAALMLVLSVGLVPSEGAWVLAIGGARYGFALGGRVAPWLRGALPFRYWRRVVTATAGVALLLATAQVVPTAVALTGLLLATVLLTESFGRDVVWLWRRRMTSPAVTAPAADALAAPQ